jgi:erythromycin esterase-like protein
MSEKMNSKKIADASISLSKLAETQFQRVREAIGNARIVLIGEETHGTQEFYALRAEITKALIQNEGFSLVLCESDFPTFYHLHRFVGGTHRITPSSLGKKPEDQSQNETPLTAIQVMEALKERFPIWMWRNEVVRDFVEWLQAENTRKEQHGELPTALFGLDIYSMFTSTDQVISYLDTVDPAMAKKARDRYENLRRYRPREDEYVRAVSRGISPAQKQKIKAMLEELNAKGPEYKNLFGDGDEYFNAHENARVVIAAEEYYRQSYFGESLTWNIRDHAMVDMIRNALEFQDAKFKGANSNQRTRAVVWAHNSHIGDASATEQYERWGQVNVGHLVRQEFGKNECFLLGLTTATGTVRAARRWNGNDFVMELNPPLSHSFGALLHSVAEKYPEHLKEYGLIFRRNDNNPLTNEQKEVCDLFEQVHLERFVGVQYVKATERQSHYSVCSMSKQFDMVIHLDETSALRPLPELYLPETRAKESQKRPGTVDYSKWDHLVVDDEE